MIDDIIKIKLEADWHRHADMCSDYVFEKSAAWISVLNQGEIDTSRVKSVLS